MSAIPNIHGGDHDSESDSKPLLTHGDEPSASHEFHNPVYESDYRYSYTDENLKYYPSGPNQFEAKLDEPFTPKPEAYTPPQEYARQTRYEDMGTCLSTRLSECSPDFYADYAEEPFTVPADKSGQMMNAKPNMFQRYFGLYPLAQRIEDKKRGVGVQRYPIVGA